MSREKDIPMKVVKEKTGLSSRQIRYYDEVNLIFPDRSPGNQRLFSEYDISKLKKIKNLLNEGYNINTIKKKLNPPEPFKTENKEENEILEIDLEKYTGNKLSSLYPVSNRSYLKKILKKNKND
ncbi:MAG: MerR family transcriptional regulator [bacterium]